MPTPERVGAIGIATRGGSADRTAIRSYAVDVSLEDDLRAAVAGLMPRIQADLESLVRIPSCAFVGFPREPVRAAAGETSRILESVGLTTGLIDIPGGEPAVVGTSSREGAPRVLLYAHYDVQPAGDLDKWHTPPFDPVVRDGRLYGRGAADDKSGIVMHAGALEAVRQVLGEIPLDVTVLVEGEEECSGPLADFVLDHPDVVQADAVVIADVGNRALGEPTLVTALRGLVDCIVEVRTLPGPAHSGAYGGPAPDALLALIRILDTLRDSNGDTTIVPGFHWEGAPVDEEDYRAEIGLRPDQPLLGTGTLADRLITRPSASVIGIDAPSVEGAINAVIPHARAKVSLRIPPGADPAEAMAALVAHLTAAAPWGVEVTVTPGDSGRGALIPTGGPAYSAACDALERAFGGAAQEAGEGGSIPLIASILQVCPTAEVMLMGAEEPQCLIHAPNESVDLGELQRMVLAEAMFLARFAGRALD